MTRVSILSRCLRPGCRVTAAAALTLAALTLTGCATRTPDAARGLGAYVVRFSVTRTTGHAELLSVSVPVEAGGKATVETGAKKPSENQPTLPEFAVRLQRAKQPGVYELVTRVAVREAIRNKKGKLKLNKRFVGALVPTRLGETQVVSPEADPIHVEARLERR